MASSACLARAGVFVLGTRFYQKFASRDSEVSHVPAPQENGQEAHALGK